MQTKVIAVLVVLLALSVGYSTLRVNSLELKLTAKEEALKSANLSIERVTGINDGLNQTIMNLNKRLEDEHNAADFIKDYVASTDASVNKAVGELKGLFNEANDDCGNKRLPQPVIDRMWQYYRSKGSNAGP